MPVWASPDTLFNYSWTNSGASPSEKTALNATHLCHKSMDEGMFFLPLRWTKRIAAAGQRRWSFLLGGLNSFAI
ncbi:MAG: hypothetical protein NTW61_04515 [Candidatus Melainabacteria bacterium]|nr:hypothetical protein [Candidatus Melainabacteria bacterium]